MKNILFVVLIIATTPILGQRLSPGFKAGSSFATLETTIDGVNSYDGRGGLYFGVSATRKINRLYAVQAELNYALSGGRKTGLQPVLEENDIPVKGSILYADYRRDIKLRYLEFPLLLKASLNNGRRLHYYIFAGPQLDVLLSARYTSTGTSRLYLDKTGMRPYLLQDGTEAAPYSFAADKIITDRFRPVTTSLTGAAGLCYRVKDRHYTIETRFNMGLMNIRKSESGPVKMRNNYLAILLGIYFSY